MGKNRTIHCTEGPNLLGCCQIRLRHFTPAMSPNPPQIQRATGTETSTAAMYSNSVCPQFYFYLFQSTNDKDIIVHLAPTPVPDEGDLSSEEEEPVPNPKQEPSRSKLPDSLPKVAEMTVFQHARQVGEGRHLYQSSCGEERIYVA